MVKRQGFKNRCFLKKTGVFPTGRFISEIIKYPTMLED